jgi:hypothetical protein
MKEFPADKQFNNLAYKLKERLFKRRMLTEEKLDDTAAISEHTPRKSLKRLAQESGV